MLEPTECVYLIGNDSNTLVKIGRSIDIQGRIATIQAMSPVPLKLLWQTLGGVELETALHRRFDERRSHGEWFDFADGDAVERVVQALPEIAAEVQRDQRIRKVWSTPPDHAIAVVNMAARPSGVTNRVLVSDLSVSPATAHRYLSTLGAEGLIEMRGRGRASAWYAVTDSPDAGVDLDAE